MDIFSTIQYYDFKLLDFIQNNLRNPILDIIMPYITLLGDNGVFWILTGLLLLIIKKHRYDGICVAIALIFSALVVNLFLKPLVARIRPYDINTAISLLVERQKDFSFPSGHTSASFAAAAALLLRNKRFGVPAVILAIIISFSRLYLYLHFPTDVFASVALGIIFGTAAAYITNNFITKRTHF